MELSVVRRSQWIATIAILTFSMVGTPHLYGFPEQLSPFGPATFSPDGQINEFIQFSGNSQEYFITDALAGADFGAIRAGTQIAPGVLVRRDNSPQPGGVIAAGQTGFLDIPGAAGARFIPTGFNIGRVFASYNPRAYGGVNGGAYFLAFDISAPGALDGVAFTQPVAFDVDGNGSVFTQTEIASSGTVSEAPVTADKFNREGYSIRLNTNGVGAHEVTITIGEQVGVIPDGAVAIDPGNTPQFIDGEEVLRYVLFRDNTQKLVATPQELALLFLDANDDGVLDFRDFGVGQDVEMVVRNVGLLPRNTDTACCTFTFIADSFDDQPLGGGGEEVVRLVVGFPYPDIEVTKEARCVGEADTAFRSSIRVSPGSEVEYRVIVSNRGNIPLTVQLSDTRTCTSPATAAYVNQSCAIVGTRPAGIRQDFCARFEEAQGQPILFPLAIGTLGAGSPCVLGLGETFVFTYRRLVGPAGNDPAFCDQAIDCRDDVSVSATTVVIDPILAPDAPSPDSPDGDSEEQHCATAQCCANIPNCVPGDGIGDVADEFTVTVSDLPGQMDTVQEMAAGRDDNGAGVEIECRGITLRKEVRLAPLGAFVTELTRLEVPPAPVRIEYRYTVENSGEIGEQATVEDPQLCGDLRALLQVNPAALVFEDCAICTGNPQGQVSGISPVGGPPFQSLCRVRFESSTALRDFMTADDARPLCRALTGQGTPDPLCHRNCATVRSQPAPTAGLCVGTDPLTDDSFATVCHEFCTVAVTKTAQCLNCTTRNPTGAATDPLPAARGACLEFTVAIRNTSTVSPVCAVRITDTLGDQPGNILFDGNVRMTAGARTCIAPQGFNVIGMPFAVDIASLCGGLPLAPQEELVLRFAARIPENADPARAPQNNVVVEAATSCPAGVPAFTCSDDDNASVDIVNPQLACARKAWEIRMDTDGDCEPDGDFQMGNDLAQAVFPVVLRVRLRATNAGDTPLNVTADDSLLRFCVLSTTGVDFEPGEPCELGVIKNLAPAASADWVCTIRVDSVDAFDDFDACDGMADGQFRNMSTVTGTVAGGIMPCGGSALLSCGGAIDTPLTGPRDCLLTVSKQVKCATSADSAYAADIDVVPGSTQTFRIQIVNSPDGADIPQVCLTDTLTCADMLVPNTVRAILRGTSDTNVTNCFMPAFASGLSGGQRNCYTFGSCRPLAPWIAAGETLIITFDVRVPEFFGIIGVDPDCRNNVTVDAHPNACVPLPTPLEACFTGTGAAQFDARVSRLTCRKEVCANLDGTVGCDTEEGPSLHLNRQTDFPLTLHYRFTVYNTGETTQTGVEFCDGDLRADLIAAGINTAACQLETDGCTNPTALSPNTSVTRTCQVPFASRSVWNFFAVRDSDGNEECYLNSGRANGISNTSGICGGSMNSAVTSPACDARVCIEPPLTGYCCRTNGICLEISEEVCLAIGGQYGGDGTECQGDNNGNGLDDACEERIPTLSNWGIVVLALLLLTGAKLRSPRPKSS